MTFTPLGARLLVERDTPKSETEGGILIPENAIEKPIFGTILATGCVTAKGLVPGARVVFARYAGVELVLDGRPTVVLEEDEVLGTWEG